MMMNSFVEMNLPRAPQKRVRQLSLLLSQSRRARSLPLSLSPCASRRWKGGRRNPRGPLPIIQKPLPVVHGPLCIMQGPDQAVERKEREDDMVLVKLGHPRACWSLTSLTTRV